MSKSIKIQDISKSYPGVKANSNVSFDIDNASIHAIVGENGAGKSTLMKILYGMVKPDFGEIYVFDEKISLSSPKDAINYGLGMVHQHFMLADNFTVLESIILGIDGAGITNLKLEKYRESINEVMSRYSLNVELDRYVDDLGVGEKQRVEILKVLFRGAKILILDEPTAVLVPQEVDELFKNLKELQKNGVTIIFISHKLDEVLKIADQITVMRGGEIVGTVDSEGIDKKDLAEMMIGKSLPKPPERTSESSQDNVLKIENLNSRNEEGKRVFEDISFEIRKSEILGIAGVEGNGQSELVEALTGLRKTSQGSINYLGENIASSTPKNIRRKKIAHIPEDRTNTGLNTQLSIWENLIGNSYFRKPLSTNGIFNLKKIAQHSNKLKEDFDIRAPNISLKVKSLSGGNQQKVVVARELSEEPVLTIASQPTRGVDIGNIEAIHEQLVQMRDEGGAVLLVSAELDEVMAVADRVGVMYEGQIVKWVNPKEVDQSQMGLYMAGVKD